MSGTESELAQEMFLARGGIFAGPLMAKRKTGELEASRSWKEYPKAIRISRGFEEVKCSTETIKGTTIEWTENREMFDEFTVDSEDEEERVLSGGKTSAQIEQERQDLFVRANQQGVKADPSWSAVRLKRELGIALDAAPVDRTAALEKELATLRKQKALEDEIASLRAQLAGSAPPSAEPDDTEDLRTELRSMGVKVDGRWNAARLREELDRNAA